MISDSADAQNNPAQTSGLTGEQTQPNRAAPSDGGACSFYYPLFEHMAQNHDVMMLDSELEDICQVVLRMYGAQST